MEPFALYGMQIELLVPLLRLHMIIACLQFANDLQALISPPVKGTPLPLVLLGKVR
jgi:hypothetical protein